MRITSVIFSVLAFVTAGYGDLTDCALPCSTDVSGSNCTKSNWPCLCADSAWVNQMNNCVQIKCNATEQEAAYLAFAQICTIFNVPLTASPEATFPASLLSANASSSLSALEGPGHASATSIPSITPVVSPVAASSDTSTSLIASSTSQAATTATATPTQGSGNAATSTGVTDVWFALAVLLLAGAAIL